MTTHAAPPPRLLRVRCARWDQVESFLRKKLRADGKLSMKVPFDAELGSRVTLQLELPNQIVIALEGAVAASDELDRPDATVVALANPRPTIDRLEAMLADARAGGEGGDLAATLSVREAELRRLRQQAAHEVLGVSRTPTLEELRRAWRLRARREHPDAVARYGSTALRLTAEEAMIHLTRAYERLRATVVAENRAVIAGTSVRTRGSLELEVAPSEAFEAVALTPSVAESLTLGPSGPATLDAEAGPDDQTDDESHLEPDTGPDLFPHPEPTPAPVASSPEPEPSAAVPPRRVTAPMPAARPPRVPTGAAPAASPPAPSPARAPTSIASPPSPSRTPTPSTAAPALARAPTPIAAPPLPARTLTPSTSTPPPARTPTPSTSMPPPARTPTPTSPAPAAPPMRPPPIDLPALFDTDADTLDGFDRPVSRPLALELDLPLPPQRDSRPMPAAKPDIGAAFDDHTAPTVRAPATTLTPGVPPPPIVAASRAARTTSAGKAARTTGAGKAARITGAGKNLRATNPGGGSTIEQSLRTARSGPGDRFVRAVHDRLALADHAGAAQIATAAHQVYPLDVRLRALIEIAVAMAAAAYGDRATAITALESAIAIDPEGAEARLALSAIQGATRIDPILIQDRFR